jgi:hypothetical protein
MHRLLYSAETIGGMMAKIGNYCEWQVSAGNNSSYHDSYESAEVEAVRQKRLDTTLDVLIFQLVAAVEVQSVSLHVVKAKS